MFNFHHNYTFYMRILSFPHFYGKYKQLLSPAIVSCQVITNLANIMIFGTFTNVINTFSPLLHLYFKQYLVYICAATKMIKYFVFIKTH